MAEETIILILLVLVMLVGSYLAGSIPMLMKLSEEKLKCVTVLGAGLLVGTALVVIIPEGIRSLYVGSGQSQKRTSVPEQPDYSQTIGLSLVLGFVFMMLVDISQRKSNVGSNKKNNATLTLGLVVHAAADGVALGAAATTSHQDVEIIVFLAIMLHKAPAAFGLVTFLLHEKVDRHQIRRHLVLFSLSAPLMTILTYFGIGQEQKDTLNSVNATGIAMLFSAGTFLYVATVHVLPELTQGGFTKSDQHDYCLLEESRGVATNDINGSNSIQALKYSELVILICGALLPLIITFGHNH
nr:Zinc/iron regulated transporter-related protein 102B, isoform F [Drosophila melanogaster]NP_651919.3 Zinc/iron regulated transporter-related protein 102B, isoform E [Drosophila melanogaster]AAF59351.3 Zinc/iron regulated transporter-related protein 102B, isoform E [Drosophila melanogaster]AHN58214.1 Zinc/iron regulated transporter-related protein 102B, isoform F [Drosophila melanogaster]|eukprot:NP_001284713.1 Zinc/iron regulated transporter-related protein 102B, isoform F [Drosophila melanogaster]